MLDSVMNCLSAIKLRFKRSAYYECKIICWSHLLCSKLAPLQSTLCTTHLSGAEKMCSLFKTKPNTMHHEMLRKPQTLQCISENWTRSVNQPKRSPKSRFENCLVAFVIVIIVGVVLVLLLCVIFYCSVGAVSFASYFFDLSLAFVFIFYFHFYLNAKKPIEQPISLG